jgi:hypothetical protein
VVVLAGRDRRLDDAQTARHSQMNDECSGVSPDQQILAAAIDVPDKLLRKPGLEPGTDRPAQLPLSQYDAGDALILNVGSDAASGRFYFGQFWQEDSAVC